jgi:LacI family transcriptional regulator
MPFQRDDRYPGRDRLSASEVFAGLDRERAPDAYLLDHSDWASGSAVPRPAGSGAWLIAVISTIPDLPQSPHPFFGRVLAGVKTALHRKHCDLLAPAHAPASLEEADPLAFERSVEHGADGLIVMAVRSDYPDYELALETGLPTVFVDFDAVGDRVGNVMSSNLEAAAGAVVHLHRLGRRRIATIADVSSTRPGTDRLLGYRSGLARLGLEPRNDYIAGGDFYHHSGYEQMKKLLDLSEPPDAVVASSDMNAVGAILAIEEAGLRVPEDIAVVGFDDAPFAELLRPALTTVNLRPFVTGITAVSGLLTMLDDPDAPPPAVRVPTELVVRESCGAEMSRPLDG